MSDTTVMLPEGGEGVLNNVFSPYADYFIDMIGQRNTHIATEPVGIYESQVKHYICQDYFDHEQKELWKKIPQFIAPIQTLEKIGDFITVDYQGRVPMIVSKVDDNHCAVFENVCPHRGARLEHNKEGCKKAFVCPYHSWSFSHQGHLIAARWREAFPEIPDQYRSLNSINVQQRFSMLWQMPGEPNPDFSLEHWFSAIDEQISDIGFEQHQLLNSRERMINANWKLLIENFIEYYHVQSLHRNSLAPTLNGQLYSLDSFAQHGRILTPLKNLAQVRQQTPHKTRREMVATYLLFPNVIIGVQPYHVFVSFYHPVSVNQTWSKTFNFIHRADEGISEVCQLDVEYLAEALEEDYEAIEQVQRNLETCTAPSLLYGEAESLIGQLHRNLAAILHQSGKEANRA
ncbi:aromatic ring-hydroxylating dioxygenase subunit alpha [Xenorhabdus khoisanae]|uniref:aromatic ring-hydroxylating oxygenase subunit alpha n=1 Tax=Xenorhabdus khoisanae TaxID=880157 RepID=UPI002358E7AF|nr:aromatic ring-hydroxylating dioxygenase subunit alpha [Xenorhabdus khoisanae]MDC9612663.1 aromatic ring-hydroxylating dioxygenase subunit alpha [Xenorhabdus khoisanae]